MYLDFFGLKDQPFRITPDTRLFFDGGNRGRVLNALSFAVKQGEGITKLVGEVGSGKTMLCRMLLNRLTKNVDWVYLANPSLSPEHILHAIAYELGMDIDDSTDKLTVMRKLQKTLLERHGKNRKVVVLVEEAQGMPLASLEEIRLLSNLETDDCKLLQIILIGQPELDRNLEQDCIRQLKERITFSFYLSAFDASDIHKYLNFRMRSVGYTGPELFDIKSARMIERYSNGLMRRANIIADKILIILFSQKRYKVLKKDIIKAAGDSQYQKKEGASKTIIAALLGVLALGFTAAVVSSVTTTPSNIVEVPVSIELPDSKDLPI